MGLGFGKREEVEPECVEKPGYVGCRAPKIQRGSVHSSMAPGVS